MYSSDRLSLVDARLILDGAAARSREIGVPMCTAVVDDGGNLVAFERQDGGKYTSISIAIDKAYASAGGRNPTSFYAANSGAGGATFGIQNTNGGRFCIVGGGVPIVVNGVVVGGVGCSSGSALQDEDVARAALDHWHARATVDAERT